MSCPVRQDLGTAAQEVAHPIDHREFDGAAPARRFRHLDLGYAPGTSWEEVKRSPAAKAIPFAVEQGLVSLPAYVLARTGELAGARAEADLRKAATVGDLVAALPGAAASALLERLGARGILGIGDALKARSLRGVAGAAGRGSALEGGTEMGQEGIEHLTARLGTATGIDAHEMADAMMAGGAAGAIFGGGARGATATGEALLGRPQARKAGAGARGAVRAVSPGARRAARHAGPGRRPRRGAAGATEHCPEHRAGADRDGARHREQGRSGPRDVSPGVAGFRRPGHRLDRLRVVHAARRRRHRAPDRATKPRRLRRRGLRA